MLSKEIAWYKGGHYFAEIFPALVNGRDFKVKIIFLNEILYFFIHDATVK